MIDHVLIYFFRAPPERDHEHLSSTSRLLEKQREVTEAEQLLANQNEVKLNFSFSFCVLKLTKSEKIIFKSNLFLFFSLL